MNDENDAIEPEIPDYVRQRIRSAAQAFGTALSLLIVGALARWLGADALPEELAEWLTYVLVPAISAVGIVVYIVVVQLIARRWPRAEAIFFGRAGDPVYIER